MDPVDSDSFHLASRCSICLDAPQQAVKIHCGHEFCRECISKWFSVQIMQERRSSTVSCPLCKNPVTPADVASTCSEAVDQIFNKLLTISYCSGLGQASFQSCPRCQAPGAVVDGCWNVECAYCSHEWVLEHPPTLAERVSKAIKNRFRNESAAWIASHTKPCYHCGAHTQKNGGCNHMTCSRCRGQWCWQCGGNYPCKPWVCTLRQRPKLIGGAVVAFTLLAYRFPWPVLYLALAAGALGLLALGFLLVREWWDRFPEDLYGWLLLQTFSCSLALTWLWAPVGLGALALGLWLTLTSFQACKYLEQVLNTGRYQITPVAEIYYKRYLPRPPEGTYMTNTDDLFLDLHEANFDVEGRAPDPLVRTPEPIRRPRTPPYLQIPPLQVPTLDPPTPADSGLSRRNRASSPPLLPVLDDVNDTLATLEEMRRTMQTLEDNIEPLLEFDRPWDFDHPTEPWWRRTTNWLLRPLTPPVG